MTGLQELSLAASLANPLLVPVVTNTDRVELTDAVQPQAQAEGLLPAGLDVGQGPRPPPEETTMAQLMRLMIEENKRRDEMMMNLVSRLTIPTVSEPSASTQNYEQYCIMPDLTKGISNFSGTSTGTTAVEWIQSLESVARLHRWPESFIIESARTHMTSAAGHWYTRMSKSGQINTWVEFKTAFFKTFGATLSVADLWKRLQGRAQRKEESTLVYFQEVAKYCQDLNLSFNDTKRQILLVGLAS